VINQYGADTPSLYGCSTLNISFNLNADIQNSGYHYFYSLNDDCSPSGTFICSFTVTCKYCVVNGIRLAGGVYSVDNCSATSPTITSNIMTLQSK